MWMETRREGNIDHTLGSFKEILLKAWVWSHEMKGKACRKVTFMPEPRGNEVSATDSVQLLARHRWVAFLQLRKRKIVF